MTAGGGWFVAGRSAFFVVSLVVGLAACSGGDTTPTPEGLAAPGGVTATPTAEGARVAWTEVPGATSYTVAWGTASGARPNELPGATSPFPVSGLAPGTLHYFAVTATGDGGESAPSAEVSATPLPRPPAAPLGLDVLAGDGKVAVHWAAIAGATGYVVRHSADPASVAGRTVSATDVTAPPLEIPWSNGAQVCVQVRARNAGGEGPPSEERCATPESVPPAPANLRARSLNGYVVLSWDAVAGTGVTYDGYYLRNVGWIDLTHHGWDAQAATQHSVNGLVNGVSYVFFVRAIVGGASGAYARVVATPEAVPAVPTGVTVVAGDGAVDVTWDPVQGSHGYFVRVAIDGDPVNFSALDAEEPHLAVPATNGTTYCIGVASRNSGGNGSAYTPDQCVVPAAPVLEAPVLSAERAGVGELLFTWPDAAGAKSYDLAWSTDATRYTFVPGVTSPHLLSGLPAGTWVYYQGFARDGVGGAHASAIGSALTRAAAAPTAWAHACYRLPGSGIGSCLGTVGSIHVDWSAVTGAERYEVWRMQEGGTTARLLATVSGPDGTWEDLTADYGPSYFYYVRAWGAQLGWTEYSLGARASRVIAPPANVSAHADARAITLRFDAVPGAGRYAVWRTTTTRWERLADPGELIARVTDLVVDPLHQVPTHATFEDGADTLFEGSAKPCKYDTEYAYLVVAEAELAGGQWAPSDWPAPVTARRSLGTGIIDRGRVKLTLFLPTAQLAIAPTPGADGYTVYENVELPGQAVMIADDWELSGTTDGSYVEAPYNYERTYLMPVTGWQRFCYQIVPWRLETAASCAGNCWCSATQCFGFGGTSADRCTTLVDSFIDWLGF